MKYCLVVFIPHLSGGVQRRYSAYFEHEPNDLGVFVAFGNPPYPPNLYNPSQWTYIFYDKNYNWGTKEIHVGMNDVDYLGIVVGGGALAIKECEVFITGPRGMYSDQIWLDITYSCNSSSRHRHLTRILGNILGNKILF